MTSLAPGFVFNPIDAILVSYYLKRKLMGEPFGFNAINEVDIYKYLPQSLPKKALICSDKEWYFFVPHEKNYHNLSKTIQIIDGGFWKSSGKEKKIDVLLQTVGKKKTFYFHIGKYPQGNKTSWIMHEYRSVNKEISDAGFSVDAFVLCKICCQISEANAINEGTASVSSFTVPFSRVLPSSLQQHDADLDHQDSSASVHPSTSDHYASTSSRGSETSDSSLPRHLQPSFFRYVSNCGVLPSPSQQHDVHSHPSSSDHIRSGFETSDSSLPRHLQPSFFCYVSNYGILPSPLQQHDVHSHPSSSDHIRSGFETSDSSLPRHLHVFFVCHSYLIITYFCLYIETLLFVSQLSFFRYVSNYGVLPSPSQQHDVHSHPSSSDHIRSHASTSSRGLETSDSSLP